MRMHPPGTEDAYDGGRMSRFVDVDKEYYIMKISEKKGKPKIELPNRLG